MHAFGEHGGKGEWCGVGIVIRDRDELALEFSIEDNHSTFIELFGKHEAESCWRFHTGREDNSDIVTDILVS
jgi:hypothetical protein